MKTSLATEMAPPFALVAHFFIAAILFLCFSAVVLFFMEPDLAGYFISFPLAAFSHLYLLGFVMMVIFGAMYQLLPVVLEVPLFSKDFAYVQFYMYIVGLCMMVSGFAFPAYHLLIPYGALITYLSITIFCVNVFLTFYRLEKSTIVSKFLLMGTIFLFASISFGFLIGLNLGHGLIEIDHDAWIKAHILGTLGGFVMMVIMGVAMVLIPMFALSHHYDERAIQAALYCNTIGISLGIVALIASLPAVILYSALLLVLCANILFIIQMSIVFRARVRKQNDYWVKNIVFALISLVASFVFIGMAQFSHDTTYVFIAAIFFFFGFLLAFIIGHLYKILPFLIWYKKFSPLVGKTKVPLLHQMIHTQTANLQAFVLFLSVVLFSISCWSHSAALFTVSASLFLLSILLVAFNVTYSFLYHTKEL